MTVIITRNGREKNENTKIKLEIHVAKHNHRRKSDLLCACAASYDLFKAGSLGEPSSTTRTLGSANTAFDTRRQAVRESGLFVSIEFRHTRRRTDSYCTTMCKRVTFRDRYRTLRWSDA